MIDLGDGNFLTIFFLLQCINGEWWFTCGYGVYIQPCRDFELCLPPYLANCDYQTIPNPTTTSVCIRVVDGVIVADADISFILYKVIDDQGNCCIDGVVMTIHLGPL